MLDIRRMRVPICLCAMAIMGGKAPADPTQPKVQDGLSEPAKAWSQAMEAGDLKALEGMQSPDVVAYPPGQMKMTGSHAVAKDYADLFAKYTVTVHDDESHYIEQLPLVASWGLTTLKLHPKAGGPDLVSHTRYTDVAIKTGNGWRYIVDHASEPKAK